MNKHNQKGLPLVSVIITTKNEEKNIKNCIDSIKKQTYPTEKIEIIVVDNNSSDKTKIISKKYTDKVYDYGPERSAQRNFGAKKSHGEYYLYLDADMILAKDVIKEGVMEFEKYRDVVGLYIPEIIIGTNFWAKVRRFERSFYNATAIDCVRFVRLKAFKLVKGFDETISGPEDWDLDKKIRSIGKVNIISSPIYHNESNFSIKNYLNKKSYYIKSFNSYINKWGMSDPDIKKQLSFYYRFLGVFIEKGKWKQLIRHPILTLGMYFLRILVGVRFLLKKCIIFNYD